MTSDEQAIRNLLFSYAERIDRGDITGMARLFEHAAYRAGDQAPLTDWRDVERLNKSLVLLYEDLLGLKVGMQIEFGPGQWWIEYDIAGQALAISNAMPGTAQSELNDAHTASHWKSVEEGARRSGRTPQRADWRLVREIYVAPTDAEAKRRVREGALGRVWREYLLPFFTGSGMGQNLVRPGDPESALSVDYLIENAWLVGSPDTVTRKLARLQEATGGFGTLLMMVYDFSTEQPWWDESLRLLTKEVMPHFAD